MNWFSKKNLILVAVIFVVGIVWYGLNVSNTSQTSTDGKSLTFSGAAGTKTVAYADLTSIDYVTDPDWGTASGGGSTGFSHYGQWTSTSLGTYTAYVDTRVKACILFKTAKETFAVNVEGADTTHAFYQTCLEWWQNERWKE